MDVREELLHYVRGQLNQGYSKAEITDTLTRNGWAQEDIDDVFLKIDRAKQPAHDHGYREKLITILMAVIAVLIIVIIILIWLLADCLSHKGDIQLGNGLTSNDSGIGTLVDDSGQEINQGGSSVQLGPEAPGGVTGGASGIKTDNLAGGSGISDPAFPVVDIGALDGDGGQGGGDGDNDAQASNSIDDARGPDEDPVVIKDGIAYQKAAPIGITPGVYRFGEIVRNSNYTGVVKVLRDPNTPFDELFDVSFTGDNVELFDGPSEFVLKPGIRLNEYEFTLNTENLPVGDYESKVSFIPLRPQLDSAGINETAGSGSSLRVGVAARIQYKVTGKEIIDFEIGDISFEESEEGTPLFVNYEVDNTGNVNWAPDQIEIEVLDRVTREVLRVLRISDLPFVSPNKRERVSVGVEHGLPAGDYDFNISFIYNNENVHASEPITMAILQRGTLEQRAELLDLSVNKKEYNTNETIFLEGLVENTGKIPVNARLVVEVSDIENNIIDVFRSERLLTIPSGSRVPMKLSTIISKKGMYTLEGYVEYGNSVTSALTAKVSIGEAPVKRFISSDDPQSAQLAIIFWIIIAIIVVGSLVGGTVLYKNKKRY